MGIGYASKAERTQTRWQSRRALDERQLPSELKSLLVESGSLTERLRANCREHFAVRVLRQARCRPGDFPEHVLSSPSAEALVREVYLECDGHPVVFAQTLVPDTTLSAHPWLAELGGKPLGHALFVRRDVTRLPFEYAELSRDHSLVASAFGALEAGQVPDGKLWARRSQFLVDGMPVSVNEVFFLTAAARVS